MEFELNIYGENDEIIKTFSTEKVRWGVFLQAFEIREKFRKMSVKDQINIVGDFMTKLFPGITSEDIENADIDDIMNNFFQLLNKAGKIVNDSKKKELGAAE